MVESSENARIKAEVGWRDFISSIQHHDRDAALNVLSRGLTKLGVGHSELTPVETATAVSTGGGAPFVVDTSRVTETGSPALKKAASAAA